MDRLCFLNCIRKLWINSKIYTECLTDRFIEKNMCININYIILYNKIAYINNNTGKIIKLVKLTWKKLFFGICIHFHMQYFLLVYIIILSIILNIFLRNFPGNKFKMDIFQMNNHIKSSLINLRIYFTIYFITHMHNL